MFLSAAGAIFSFVFLLVLPVLGISQGIQPIIGFNYGAKKFDRVKDTLVYGTVVATVITTLGFIVMQVFPGQLMSIFNSQDAEFIASGSYIIRISMIFVPIIGLPMIVSGYFQAVGKAKQAMFVAMSRQVLFLIPALYILPLYFQLEGVLASIPFADLISFVITGSWLLVEIKNLNSMQKKQEDLLGVSLPSIPNEM